MPRCARVCMFLFTAKIKKRQELKFNLSGGSGKENKSERETRTCLFFFSLSFFVLRGQTKFHRGTDDQLQKG